MHSLQRKLLYYIVIIGVIPILLFSFYYYKMVSEHITDKLYSESQSVLQKTDNQLVVKISRLQNAVDITLDNTEFFKCLRRAPYNPGKQDAQVMKELEEIYGSFAKSERALMGLIFFPVSGPSYVLGKLPEDFNPVRFIMSYDDIAHDAGVLSWVGLENYYETDLNNVIVAGTMLRDNIYQKDQAYLGSIYMVFDNLLFMGGAEPSEAESYVTDAAQEATFSVYDSNAKLIYAKGDVRLRNVFLERPIANSRNGYGEDTGSFKITVDDTEYLVIYYTSPVTGWKLVRPIACEPYYGELRYVKYTVLLAFCLMLAIWFVCNYFLVKRIMLPIRELMGAMQNIEKDNFETVLPVRSHDEFGVITGGFNAMVKHIKNLLVRIRSEEEKRRQSDILMLRYQMNPHFLYNTIAAIRLTAIISRQGKIADMLLILGRFLRNAILTVNSTLDVQSEIENIKDYIALYQLRYNNGLHVEIKADDDCLHDRILSMLCQPIIENSIVHGLEEKLNTGEEAILKIRIFEENDCLCISVYDNGKGMTDAEMKAVLTENCDNEIASNDRLHIGILNTHKRIKMIFGDAYGVTVTSKVHEYTEVKIKLPKIQNDVKEI